MVVLKDKAVPAAGRETVVLLHGIGHSRWNMMGTEWALRRRGYDVVNITYPSLKRGIGALAGFVHERLERDNVWGRSAKVHFVTHSMGGLVARCYLDTRKDDIPAGKMGRFVMLAPPNRGSEIADLLHRLPPYRWLFGPAGQELCTAVRSDGAAPSICETGIIAGNKGWLYPVANLFFKGGGASHDGRVAVERTKLPGMKDHFTLSVTHDMIAWKGEAHRQIVHFLRNGTFKIG